MKVFGYSDLATGRFKKLANIGLYRLSLAPVPTVRCVRSCVERGPTLRLWCIKSCVCRRRLGLRIGSTRWRALRIGRICRCQFQRSAVSVVAQRMLPRYWFWCIKCVRRTTGLTGVDIRYMRVNCSAAHTVLLGDHPHLSHELVASSDARERRQVLLIHCVCCREEIGVCVCLFGECEHGPK